MRHVSMQDHFEAGQGVVPKGAVAEDAIADLQRVDFHVVVQDNRPGRLHVALDPGALQEDHLGVVVRVGAHLKLAFLQTIMKKSTITQSD